MKVIKKGYRIDLDKIEEGYMYSDYTCTADTLSKAKSILLKDAVNDGMTLKWSAESIKYINLPVVRDQNCDLVEFNDKEVGRIEVTRLQRLEKHNDSLQAILNDAATTHCYIKKRGIYYSENYNGYVEYKLHAGIYPKADACTHARNCEELTVIPIVNKEHNDYLNSHIERIKARLIQLN